MNTGNEYSDIVQKINKGNVVDGREEMYSTLRDGSLKRRVKEDNDVEDVLFKLNMCIFVWFYIEGVFDD